MIFVFLASRFLSCSVVVVESVVVFFFSTDADDDVGYCSSKVEAADGFTIICIHRSNTFRTVLLLPASIVKRL